MRTSVVVIGAGHAGMAMSRCLTGRSVDHVVLERGEVANSWKTERWDSLRLLTPTWQSRLPGAPIPSDDPHGFRTMPETVEFLSTYARALDAPVYTQTRVRSVTSDPFGEYRVETNRGTWHTEAVVLATGACNIPRVPGVAAGIPSVIRSVTPFQYRNPDSVEEGGVLVVGASATGVQIAEELRRSGRPVTLAVGEHVRVPRSYRGRDVQWWMDASGVLSDPWHEMENLDRARSLPSFQLAGTKDRRAMDLNTLTDQGVRIVGRLAGVHDGRAMFSGSLANMAALADLKMNRLLDRFDDWAEDVGLNGAVEAPHRFEPTRIEDRPRLTLDLGSGEIRTVLWATGFRPDYSWLNVPVLNRKGRLKHDGGVVEADGLYAMGLPFMRTRRSSLIDGAADDARDLSDHLLTYLNHRRIGRMPLAATG